MTTHSGPDVSPASFQEPSRPVKKKAVAGSIKPRWPKPRVVKWLEVGAVPAILGLWLPDWVGAYVGGGLAPALGVGPLPPIVTYAGALILIVACYQGIKGMGAHFRGVVVSGSFAVAFAAGSLALQLFGWNVASLLTTGLAAVFATGALWFTIGKVAEITQESRARRTWLGIAATTAVSAAMYMGGVYAYASQGPAAAAWPLRGSMVGLTVTFALCRYGVHCYKTQTSIGAGFRSDPDEQYWAAA